MTGVQTCALPILQVRSKLKSVIPDRLLPEPPEECPIKVIRESKGLNIKQAAERLGISKDKLIRMEQGVPKNSMEHVVWLIELGAYDLEFSQSKLIKEMRAWRLRDHIGSVSNLKNKHLQELEALVSLKLSSGNTEDESRSD